MKARRGSKLQLHPFFNLDARWGGLSTPSPGHFTLRKGTRLRLGGPQDRFERISKISPPTWIRSPNRLAFCQSLYRVCYTYPLLLLLPPAPSVFNCHNTNTNLVTILKCVPLSPLSKLLPSTFNTEASPFTFPDWA